MLDPQGEAAGSSAAKLNDDGGVANITKSKERVCVLGGGRATLVLLAGGQPQGGSSERPFQPLLTGPYGPMIDTR